MRTFITVLTIIGIWRCCYAPPVTKNEKEEPEKHDPDYIDFIHYSRYLKLVVNALESDPGFKKKLEEASEDDIKSGKIAHELDFVGHHIRSQLDELKRIELQRLIDFKHKLVEQEVDTNAIGGDALHGHLDHRNRDTFEIEDLKKLIAKTTSDLAEADRIRREEFKQYELQKEYDKQEQLNHTNGSDERIKLEQHYKEMEEKHKKHDPLHEPGHKAQLEEVWQEQDHMQQKFDPIAFFMMHDIDSSGFWDQNEVKALFIKELNKLYEAGAPEDDLRERAEEMERMRETVFKEMDRDNDGLISRREFIEQTKRNEFEQDHGWKGIDEQGHPYSDEELQEYIRQQHMLHPPPPPAYHPQAGGQYPPGSYHPNQIPQQGYVQPPPGQYYQGQPPPHPQYQQQQPPQQYQQQQPPQQYQQQPPPGQYQQPPQPVQYQQPQVPNPPPPVQQFQQPGQAQAPHQPPPPPAQQQYQQPQVQQVGQPSANNQPASPQVAQLNTNEHHINVPPGAEIPVAAAAA